jgi:hypothetical protein
MALFVWALRALDGQKRRLPARADLRLLAQEARSGSSAHGRSRARSGAQDRASPNFMGLTRLGLDIGIFCDF